MPIMKYDEQKTAQLAAYFLQKNSGELYLIKLLKLLYIADREAFRVLGRPISSDKYVSMDNGPVLSQTYNLMTGSDAHPNGHWNTMIADRSDHKLSVIDQAEISNTALSDAELSIADQVFEMFGKIPRFELCELTHDFEEWKNPHGSSLPISYHDIFRAVGYTDEQTKYAIEQLATQQEIDEFFKVA